MEHKYKRRKSKKPAIILTILLLIATLVGFAGYFGYNYLIRVTHPIKYSGYVEKYSRDNDLNKYLVYSVIKTESGFDNGAVSNVGARGLMQITEPTFEWIRYKLGEDEETVYLDMFDPETNIKYGCYLLGFLSDEFGNIEAIMSAYHAGRGEVNGWLADRSISSDGVHLDTIPIPDTNHYVAKIKKALETYTGLYSK